MANKGKENKIKEKEEGGGYAALEFTQRQSKKKRRIRSLILLLFNIVVLAAIILIEFLSPHERADIGTVLRTWGENWYFLVALIAIVILYYLFLTMKISVLIRATTGRPRRKLSFSTAVLGKYYDNITPLGSGGQPFQMYNLSRKLDIGVATSIPVADLIMTQFVFTALSIVCFAVNPGVMAGNDFLRITAYVGVGFYAFIPVLMLLFSIFPSAILAIARFFCRVGHKLRLVKDLEKAEEKVTHAVKRYSSSLKTVGSKWWYLLLSFIITVASWLALASMPYFVLSLCGEAAFSFKSYFDTVCKCLYVYASVAIVPTPGNAGAAEGAFYFIFADLSGPFLFWGTMLWRICTYYASLISGFSVTIYQYVKISRREKKNRTLQSVEAARDAQAVEAARDAQNDEASHESSAQLSLRDKNENV